MKKLLLIIFVSGTLAGLFAANTQIALINTGKTAVIKYKAGNAANVRTQSYKDPKTGERKWQSIYFNITSRSQSEVKKISFSFDAAQGDVTLYVGHKKAAPFFWTKLTADGKELLNNKKGEIIQGKQFAIGKIDKSKEIKIEGSYRLPTRKELNAEKKSSKAKNKQSKKSTKNK